MLLFWGGLVWSCVLGWVWVVYVVLFIDWGLGVCVIDVGYGGWVWGFGVDNLVGFVGCLFVLYIGWLFFLSFFDFCYYEMLVVVWVFAFVVWVCLDVFVWLCCGFMDWLGWVYDWL